jgi:hypothetical protein
MHIRSSLQYVCHFIQPYVIRFYIFAMENFRWFSTQTVVNVAMSDSLLPRLHLFEWEDQYFFPHAIRNALTKYLFMVWTVGRFYKSTLPVLQDVLRSTTRTQIYDLCSGSGGAWSHIVKEMHTLHPTLTVHLSDHYPNLEAFEQLTTHSNGSIQFNPTSVDARSTAFPEGSIVTLLLALHHFMPEDVRKILSNATEQHTPIVIFEIQQRTLFDMLIMLVHIPLCWLVMPFMQPSWTQLFFTYVLPIIPLCIVWDGIVSALRTYTPTELHDLAKDIDQSNEFKWTSGKSPHPIHNLTYFVGTPKHTNSPL